MFNKLFGKKRQKKNTMNQQKGLVKDECIPSHIAIIMDGNGRWAKKRAMPRIKGIMKG